MIHWRAHAVRIPVTLLIAAMLVVFQCALVMDVKLDDLEKAKNTSNKSEWGGQKVALWIVFGAKIKPKMVSKSVLARIAV